jgi:hypothetical protein
MARNANDLTVLNNPVNYDSWNDVDYRQFVSIDPAVKNIGMRVERRWFDRINKKNCESRNSSF